MSEKQEFLVDRVEKKLLHYLKNNNIKPGDALPKEKELAERLMVSRTVIREALSKLRSQGLIETRKRRGSVFKSPEISAILENALNPNMLDNSSLRDYFEIRLSLEIGMADLIMARKTVKDIEELKSIVNAEPALSGNTVFNAEHEIKFHGKLYSITGNKTLMDFQRLLLPVFDYVHTSGILDKPIKTQGFISHKHIVEIVENGNADILRSAMRSHLDSHFKRLFG